MSIEPIPPPHQNTNNQTRFFFCILICILIFTCYSNSIQTPFQFDDKPNIVDNTGLHIGFPSINNIWKSMHANPTFHDSIYRPISSASFAINWYFSKENVLLYHIINIAIHFFNTLLIFSIICSIFNSNKKYLKYTQEEKLFIAAISAILWSLNPIHTQAVTYIVQRMALLCTFFSLLSIFYYLKYKTTKKQLQRSIFLITSFIFYISSIFSKENGAIIILLVPVIDYIIFDDLSLKKLIYSSITGIIIICFAVFLFAPNIIDLLTHSYTNRSFTLKERIFTEPKILLDYLSVLAFPHPARLSLEHDITVFSSLIKPPSLAILYILLDLAIISSALIFKKKNPIISFSIIFYFITHIPESTILPLELYFEHRNYMPSSFLFTIIPILLINISHTKKILILSGSIILSMITTEGIFTYSRNNIWKTEESLWIDAIKKAPNSARPYYALGWLLNNKPDADEKTINKAIELTQTSLTLRQARQKHVGQNLSNIGSMYSKLGKEDLALEYFQQAYTLDPDDRNLRFNLSKSLIINDELEDALEIIKNDISNSNKKSTPNALNLAALISFWEDKPDIALLFLQKSMEITKINDPTSLFYLGKYYMITKDHDKAIWYYSRSIERSGLHPIALLFMIENELDRNDIQKANSFASLAQKQNMINSMYSSLQDLTEKSKKTPPLNTELVSQFLKSHIISLQ